ncbi:MAG: metallophosphatase family protein [Actinobacteria bacterium]|nr:metallophosphatase family protein [Actinomycetota bacterium]
MRLGLISDIHGNRLALEAVLADIDRRGVEVIYSLGDLVGYGPDPNGVIDLVRARGIPSLMGNYDDGVGFERGDCGCFYRTAEAKRIGAASYAFTVAEVTTDRKAFLRSLPPEMHLDIGGVRIHLVHGSPRRINEYLLRDRDERTFRRLAEAEGDDVLAFGHTHESWDRVIESVLFVNVGSVGRPKDGDPRAMYSVLSIAASLRVEHIRVAYDGEATVRAIEEVGLPGELGNQVRLGR